MYWDSTIIILIPAVIFSMSKEYICEIFVYKK